MVGGAQFQTVQEEVLFGRGEVKVCKQGCDEWNRLKGGGGGGGGGGIVSAGTVNVFKMRLETLRSVRGYL